ncbi:solute carrier organic anion transporter family member 3A1-like [Amphiura filiformis]|uniref:solute carrier organic anion transporter family member 3A1-like n=1 Tax=Amphiura filiformis TaxID=82378 RepID=UPI003B213018
MISHFISAFVMRKLKHNSTKAIAIVVVLQVIVTIVLTAALFVKCPTPDIAGYTVSYRDRTSSECYDDCFCQDQDFFPVCGADGITYTSPCVAGCTSSNISFGSDGPQAGYRECSCVSEVASSSFSATPGFCELKSECYMVIVSVLLICVTLFLGTFVVQPLLYTILRICDDDDRPVALGLFGAITKTIGLIPAPIYFGAAINSTCQFWRITCGEQGNCFIYDIDKFRYYFFGLTIGLSALTALFNAFARYTLPSALYSHIKKQPEHY